MTDQHTDRAPRRRGLVGRMLGERYRITRVVASGSSTIVVDAEDEERHRPVTVKLVRPEWAESTEFRDHFRQTMRMVAKLSHPNIAAVHDWGEEVVGNRTTTFAVTEFLSGGSLRDLFDRGRYLDPSQALMVGLEACRGLDFAHRKGLVHSELTPAKLVFGDDRRLRIVDFGLARLLGRREWEDPSDVATHVARYASPEQAVGERLDGRSDVYSLALVLVEAVSRRVPFAERSTVATLSARVGRLMPVSADLGPLAAVLERAGRPIAADRSTAAELGRGLVRVAEKLPRPSPIPILVSEPFEDTSSMRRPNDPTGGVRRPQPEPEVALVPPVVAPPAAPDLPPPSPDEPATAEPVADLPVVPAVEPVAAEPVADLSAVSPVDSVAAEPATDLPAAAEATTDDEAEPAAPAAPAGVEEHADPVVVGPEPIAEPAAVADAPQPDADADPDGPIGDDDDSSAAGAVTTAAAAAVAAAAATDDERALYDGDTDVTKDELAALARRRAPTDGGHDRPGPGDRPAAVATRGSAVPAAAAPPPRPSTPPAAPERDGERSRWLIAVGGFLVLAALAGLAFVAYLLFRVPRHEVPALAGLDLTEAQALIADFEWDVEIAERRSDEEPDVGQVIESNPSAGDDLAEGEPFQIVVSAGPELRTLPELAGLTRGEAETRLAELRLVAVPEASAYSEDVPEGSVISWAVTSDPSLAAGDQVLPETEVAFVVSDGPEPRTLPDLVGMTVEEATAALEELRINVNVSEPVFDNEVEAGIVVGANPPAETVVERGSTVTITASKGPDLVVLPDVDGLTLAQARAALNRAGLQVGSLLGNTRGEVVRTSVAGDVVDAGDEFLRYTAIDLALI